MDNWNIKLSCSAPSSLHGPKLTLHFLMHLLVYFFFFTILLYSILCTDINKGFLHLIALVKSYYINCLVKGLCIPARLLARTFASSELTLCALTYNSTVRYFMVAQETFTYYFFSPFIYTENQQLPRCFHNSIHSLRY